MADALSRLDEILQVFDGEIPEEAERGSSILRYTSLSERFELLDEVRLIMSRLEVAEQFDEFPAYRERSIVSSCKMVSLLGLRTSIKRLMVHIFANTHAGEISSVRNRIIACYSDVLLNIDCAIENEREHLKMRNVVPEEIFECIKNILGRQKLEEFNEDFFIH